MVTEKLLKQFIIFLYQWHVEENGESISTLRETGFSIADGLFASEKPDAVANISKECMKDLTFNLAKEAAARDFVEIENLIFFLTPNGFKEAKRLLHPIRTFMNIHWKWLVATFFTA